MKKDKKWFVDKWTKERDKSAVHDPMYHFINEFITDVKELDEPEVFSQEWTEKHTWNNHYIGKPFVYVEDLQNLLVPKQELPVIPKYVAEWITKHRDTFDLYPMLKRLEKNSSTWELTYKWYRMNTRKFVNAYLTGEYEVEEEPLYYALVKGHELIAGEDACKYWKCKAYNSGDLLIGSKYPKASCINRMTKNNWDKLGINDTNADFVKVEENE